MLVKCPKCKQEFDIILTLAIIGRYRKSYGTVSRTTSRVEELGKVKVSKRGKKDVSKVS
jgi:hypothetical protein